MPAFVHDPRHAYSFEVRPAADLDARLRAVAADLESRGLIPAGATTAPRFHPHLTLLRAALPDLAAATAAAGELAAAASAVRFASVGTFGDGRIVYVEPADRAPLDAARAQLLSRISDDLLDPLALERELTPHVTLAYSVPAPTRAAAAEAVAAALPIEGRWGTLEVWYLDVRPTELVHRIALTGD